MGEFPKELDDLPGADLVAAGMADIGASRVSENACLVAMVSPHLQRAGIRVGQCAELIPEPERTLYRLLGNDGTGRDPYSRYNALKRRIVSFARALSASTKIRHKKRSGTEAPDRLDE